MAESSTAFTQFRVNSDPALSSEDEEYVSSASTASAGSGVRSKKQANNVQGEIMTAYEPIRNLSLTDNPSVSPDAGAATSESKRVDPGKASIPTRRPLHLLDLPMDILQEIIKEVTHTNDLTSLALTCSALHALAIPQMYSRFDIVWPDTLSSSDHPAGVDALSYGLATLVMGQDVFHQLPPSQRPSQPCPTCGCSERDRHDTTPTPDALRKARRGNYYAQYTRKFSVGNGPLVWVQEYAVTKETGKMLGTLVALAVARMINLEAFIWDMPTGVLRDVWIALASLADRPGHDCRLERVWVRWHDNSDNAMRPLPTSSSIALPQTQTAYTSGSPLMQRYAHVEYPSMSILPPLKSLSVLDIDEVAYLEETAVLIDKSWDKLKELRIGISTKIYQLDWLKPAGGWSLAQDLPYVWISGWPKAGGVLGVLFSGSGLKNEPQGAGGCSMKGDCAQAEPSRESATPTGPTTGGSGNSSTEPSSSESPHAAPSSQAGLVGAEMGNRSSTEAVNPSPEQKNSTEAPGSPVKTDGPTVEGPASPGRGPLKLETLELERVALSIPVMTQMLDWSRITSLTILRCEGHEKLWRALRRQFTPSPAPRSGSKSGKKDTSSPMSSSPEYTLRIKHLHTDAVSPYLLLFIKDALAPNTLETVFLHDASMYDSIVHVDAIYRNVMRNHRSSLRKILIDSTERSPSGIEIASSRWRKWMFTREMISFVTSGRMPRLREISMTIRSKDWHYFIQRLPNVPHLRALHISHIADAVHRDAKELALQILDIVTIRPDIGLTYVGMQDKCYEIIEGKRCDKDDFDDVYVPGGSEDWPASDDDTEDENDDDAAASVVDSNSELSSDRGSLSDDESDAESRRSRVTFRLREILFYDDKIAIFKARHGIL
ncbi:conserved hypothetical protein [Aspergillus terreus NIH2624]|uniref:F-box domain-containing protein n=1 Tax=Aspergillus terreus (strain NIH 2624 / FGSC A1156) TaxID=341663 RepID=Q0CJZ8_ASPTN|nr:uncharacterized protein ATEG_05986 [Aspergillus terreus NIH2624]EAU33747.1 conserved hypothetical protein [Aspergillus terreus NIH2624]